MRIVVFRGSLTINNSPDHTLPLVERLRDLGHDVLHTTTLSHPGQEVSEVLCEDLISHENFIAFDPEAVFVEINDNPIPKEQISRIITNGGSAVYAGPFNGWPNLDFLASRGFFLESLGGRDGPRPIRRFDNSSIYLTRESLCDNCYECVDIFHGVHCFGVRCPYVISKTHDISSLISVTGSNYCTWNGEFYLDDRPYLIGARRRTKGTETLITGDVLYDDSDAVRQCNIQLIVNLLVGKAPSLTLRGVPLDPINQKGIASGQVTDEHQSIYICAKRETGMFVSYLSDRLKSEGYSPVVSHNETVELDELLGKEHLVFVPIIDRELSKSQKKEIEVFEGAIAHRKTGLRVVPIQLSKSQSQSKRREQWVWLDAQDPTTWEEVSQVLIRTVCRNWDRFEWKFNERGRRIFISYAFQDSKLAFELAGRLEQSGFDVFCSDKETLVNSQLRKELRRLVSESDIFIPIVTKHLRLSNWSFFEAETAISFARAEVRPNIIAFADSSQRLPRWFEGYPVCRTMDQVEQELCRHN